ncbi:MAG TPA: hypothetical protein VN226_07995 [Anaerolineales bacterium]|nr:hypothetical protein [Anaerolineales bacterium]
MSLNIFARLFALFAYALMATGCSPSEQGGLWGKPLTPTIAVSEPVIPSKTPNYLPTLTSSPTPKPRITVTPLSSLPEILPGLTLALPLATLPPINQGGPMESYFSQSGDTLEIISNRFEIPIEYFQSPVVLPKSTELLPTGTLLLIPKREGQPEYSPKAGILPDTEFVFGPATIGFDLDTFIQSKNGLLSEYREYIMSGGWHTGSQAVMRIAEENSINPKLILAIIEIESNWLTGYPENYAEDEYPLGHRDYLYRGFFRQLMWASGQLSKGYYEWRSGKLTSLTFRDGSQIKINPNLNAGTVAVQYYFSQTRSREDWEKIVSEEGFIRVYKELYGDPLPAWEKYGPTLPAGIQQPQLSFPIEVGKLWAFISGPHSAWEKEGAQAAVDFAPASDKPGCIESPEWVVAPADGVVVRVDTGVVVLDLDGDGLEQTGWNLLFLHISSKDKVDLGSVLNKNDRIGHPSCEGGVSTGTHLHFARKFNGEWVLAAGSIPMILNGWEIQDGGAPYKGSMTLLGQTIRACTCSDFTTHFIRKE